MNRPGPPGAGTAGDSPPGAAEPNGPRPAEAGVSGLGRCGLALGSALVGVAPLVILPGNFDAANLPQSAWIEVVAFGLLTLWALRALGAGARVPPLAVAIPLLTLVTWSGLSLSWARNRHEGVTVFAHWAACAAAYLAFADLLRSARGARVVLLCGFAGGVLVAGLGLLQQFFGVDWVPQAFPPAATFVNKNMAAEFMVMALPWGLALGAGARGRSTVILFGLGTGLLAVFLYFTFTRSAWLGAIVEAALLLAWSIRGRPPWVRALLAGGGAALGASLVFAVFPLGKGWNPAMPLSDAEVQALPASVLTARERLAIWRNTLELVWEHPVAGVGLGNLRIQYPLYARRAAVDPSFGEGFQLDYAHNDYLEVWAELGSVGAALLAWVGTALLRTLGRVLREPASPEQWGRLAGALGLAGISVDAFFSFPAYRAVPPLLAAVDLALLGVPAPGVSAQGRSVRLGLPPWARLGALALLLAGGGALVRVESRWILSDRACSGMFRELARGNAAGALALARTARDYCPARGEPFFGAGSAYLSAGQPALAAGAFQGFLERYPHDLSGLANLGLAYAQSGRPREALECDRRVLALKEDEALIHYRVATLLSGLNEGEAALEEYRLAARYAPDTASYQVQWGLAALAGGARPEAEEALTRAVALNPASATAHKALGLLLVGEPARREEGLSHLRRALALDPRMADADRIREILEGGGRPPTPRRPPP